MRFSISILILVLATCFVNLPHTLAQPVTEGPDNGALIIMGGAASDSVFKKHFALLAGGLDAEVVIVPSAGSDNFLKSDGAFDRVKQPFLDFGFTNVKVIHTRDRNLADTQEFADQFKTASGIWFTGGRQWRVTKTYLGTLTEQAFHDLLDRGGVIAGSSAGASLQASFLVRGEDGDNTIMMGDYQEGFGFLANSAVDQHLLARNRQFDLFEVLRKHDGLLGIGIDENTGIIVRGDRFRVIGNSYVAIYDGTRWSAERDTIYVLEEGEEQFYLLEAGQDYDLRKRKVVLPEDRKAVKFDTVNMKRLAGTYRHESQEDYYIKVSIDNNRLVIQSSWNRESIRLFPESYWHFFEPDQGITFTFNRNKYGKVIGLTSRHISSTYWIKND